MYICLLGKMDNLELNCVLCMHKIIDCWTLYPGTKICTECIYNLNNDIYHIKFNVNNDVNDTSSMSSMYSTTSSQGIHLEVKQDNVNIIDNSNCNKDVLDDLMDLHNVNVNVNGKKKTCDELDTSSFVLDDIIKRISDKNKLSDEININYRDALLTSLYAHVEFLRKECSHKNDIIKALIKDPLKSSECTRKKCGVAVIMAPTSSNLIY